MVCLWEASTTVAQTSASRYPWEDAAPSDEDLFDGQLVEPGRRALPFTYVHDWVALSDASPLAKFLYVILRMYVYDKSGTRTAGPRQEDLALMMGLPRGDKVSPFLRELEKLGAIETFRWGIPARNKYRVHETPPEDYTGPVSIAEWKLKHEDERARRKQVAKDANAAKKNRLRSKAAAGQGDPLPLDQAA